MADLRRGKGLPDGTGCLVICEQGTRSAEVVRLLRHSGIDARYLGGGLHWVSAIGEGEKR
jgi:rhodanese-related sulfurtransferase